jgi:hypothetical protein
LLCVRQPWQKNTSLQMPHSTFQQFHLVSG